MGKPAIADFLIRVFTHQMYIWVTILHKVVWMSFLSRVVVGKATIADFVIRGFTHQIYIWVAILHNIVWMYLLNKVVVGKAAIADFAIGAFDSCRRSRDTHVFVQKSIMADLAIEFSHNNHV